MLLGAQTYTIRQFMQSERDFAESMRRLAQMGYTSIQLSGAGPLKPEFIRAACDDNGLTIVLTHTKPERILNDIDGVIREHQTLGCKYVGIGSMPERYRCDAWIDRFAVDYTAPAQELKDAGMYLMYHNHNFEWQRLANGRRMIDVLLSQMPAELMGVTLDTYWVQAAGADVLAWIDSLAGRIPCLHLKDMAVCGFQQRFAPVGEGNMDFARILQHAQAAGVEHILVEQDDCYGESPFDCLGRSLKHVREMGY